MPKIYNLTDNWNDGTTVFDAIKINVTDTASDATSKLLDLQIGGTSKFKVDKGGNVTLDGSITGLDQVDNTSDLDKPVSTLQATAIGVVQTDVDNHEALTNNPHTVTAAQVGLGNVDNTSDLDKPISTLTQAAIDAAGGGAFDADANTLITASTPIVLDQATDEAALTLDYTTNKAAGNDTGLLINQTDTLISGTSKLLDLQVGGTSKFSVDSGGTLTTTDVTFTNALGLAYAKWEGASRLFYAGGNAFAVRTDTAETKIFRDGKFGWTGSAIASTPPMDLILVRDAANTLGQRNGVNAQTFNIYNTYTDASNYERGHIGWNDTADTFVIGTEAAGTGAARSMSLLSGFGTILGLGNGAVDWQIVSSNLRPAMDNVRDLGHTSKRLKNVYIGTTLGIAQGTLTDDAQALNITSTWNDAADTFTLIQADVTDTASAAGSNLMDLQVGGASKFNVASSGATTIFGSGLVNGDLRVNRIDTRSTGYVVIGYGSGNSGTLAVKQHEMTLQSSTSLKWSSTTNLLSASDLALVRDAANTLAQRNGVNAQTFNIYNTYTGATNYERAHIGWNDTADTFVIGTEAAGTGVARDVELKRDGESKMILKSGGLIEMENSLGSNRIRINHNSNTPYVQVTQSTGKATSYYPHGLTSTAEYNIIAANGLGIGIATPTVALDVSGSIAATGTVKTTPTTVGALPAAATAGAGARTFVTDAANTLSSHHGQTVVGGGTNFTPVFSDGTNWVTG